MNSSIKQCSHIRRRVGQLTLACFLVQAVFPVGYMPAALSSGWFLQLCPDGVSPAVMAVLHGDLHAHHQSQQSGSDAQHETWRFDCSFSASTITKVAGAFGGYTAVADISAAAYAATSTIPLLLARPSNSNRPRAPPGLTHV